MADLIKMQSDVKHLAVDIRNLEMQLIAKRNEMARLRSAIRQEEMLVVAHINGGIPKGSLNVIVGGVKR